MKRESESFEKKRDTNLISLESVLAFESKNEKYGITCLEVY